MDNANNNQTEISTSSESPITQLAKYDGDDRIISFREMREKLNEKSTATFRADTGFPSLDSLTGGIEGGELIIVSGKTKNGKTTLLQSMTDAIGKTGQKVLWFSYEVPVRQFLDQLEPTTDGLVPLRLTSNGLIWIFRRYFEARIKHGCRIIVIDHLHYLIDMAKIRNPALEIGAVVRQLKRMAVEWEMVIFLVSHVRNIEKGTEATEDDLRDSGMTKAEADSTWMVTRKFEKGTKQATSRAMVRVCNHRRTGVMGQYVHLVKDGKYFIEDPTNNSVEETNVRATSKPRGSAPIDADEEFRYGE